MMQDIIATLLEVQDKDIRVFNLRKQIESVPAEKKKIEKLIHDSEEQLTRAKETLQATEAKIKEVELEIAAHKEKILNLQSKSTAIKKNDEYRALLKEVDLHNKRISEFEDKQLEHWEALEKAKAERAQATKNREATQARIQGAYEDLDVRDRNCTQQVDKVIADRNAMLTNIPEDLLRIYQRLVDRPNRTKHFRKVLVPIQNGNCGGCFLAVTPNIKALAKKKLVPCENCGVLLFYER